MAAHSWRVRDWHSATDMMAASGAMDWAADAESRAEERCRSSAATGLKHRSAGCTRIDTSCLDRCFMSWVVYASHLEHDHMRRRLALL